MARLYVHEPLYERSHVTRNMTNPRGDLRSLIRSAEPCDKCPMRTVSFRRITIRLEHLSPSRRRDFHIGATRDLTWTHCLSEVHSELLGRGVVVTKEHHFFFRVQYTSNRVHYGKNFGVRTDRFAKVLNPLQVLTTDRLRRARNGSDLRVDLLAEVLHASQDSRWTRGVISRSIAGTGRGSFAVPPPVAMEAFCLAVARKPHSFEQHRLALPLVLPQAPAMRQTASGESSSSAKSAQSGRSS